MSLPEEDIVLVFPIFDHAKSIAHSPFANHLASQTSHLLDIARGAIGNVLTIEFLGNPSCGSHCEQVESSLRWVEYLSPSGSTWSHRESLLAE